MNAEKLKTILLVEDEAIIAMSEKITLEKFGYAVIIAITGEEAVEIAGKNRAIDLILMDINLGKGMDGTEAAALILKERDLPVVFLSSHMEPEIVAKTEKITSYGYVVKNSSSTVLAASIKMAFKLFEANIKEKEKEAALRESEASYRVLFSRASDGILLADAQTRQFRYANPSICRMLGYTEDEFQRLSVADIHPKESLDHVLAEFAALARGKTRSSPEIPCQRKDGTVFYADISQSSVTLEGREYHAGFFHDITERRRANNAIKENELRLKAQYLGMPVPTFTWRKKGEDFELIDFNDAAKTITHEKTSEFVGRKASDLYAGRQDILHDLQQCSVEGKIIKRETQSEHFIPGKHIALTIVPIPADLIMVHMEDISERKQAESEKEAALEALRETKEKFRNMAEQLEDVLFTTDDYGTITYVSPSTHRVFGRFPEEMIGRKFVEFLLESDIPKALQAFRTTISTGQPNQNLNLLMKRRDGSIFYGELKGSPLDKKRGISGTMGLIRDISESKKAEAALLESEERYRTLIENASDLVYRTDKAGRFTYMNRAAIAISGYEERELIGKFYSSLIRPDMRNQAVKIFLHQIRKGTHNTYSEFPILTKDGRELWIGQNIQLVVQNGQVTGFQAVSRDISERKRAEEGSNRQLSEKEVLLKEVHHRIKNNIASIGSLISLRLQSVANPEAVTVLQDTLGRVDSIRVLYDKLLLSEDYQDIPVKNYVESLIDAIVALFPGSAKVKVDRRVDDFHLDPKRLFPLGLIINELLTNKMKFAFIGRDAGKIRISLTKVDKHVKLFVEDDGNGLPDGFDVNESKGFGLMLVKMLSQQLGGSFSIAGQAGTPCRIEFNV